MSNPSDSESEVDITSDESDVEAAETRTKFEASQLFTELLVQVYLDNLPISAKTLCLLAWWACKGGLTGFVEDLAYPPGRQSGKYSQKVKKALRFDIHDERLYKLETVCYDKFDRHRSVHHVWVLPPHEALHEQVSNEPSLADRVADSIKGADWADNYLAHPVVTNNPGKVVHPYALYVDGAPFTKHDGFVAISFYHLLEGSRLLSVLLRKSNMCKCGCRGWCTLYPVLYFLHCSIMALSVGKFWDYRHDNQPWIDGVDDFRNSVAGLEMALLGALVQIKNDWMEYSTTFGLPTWSSLFAPCPLCDAEQHELHLLEDVEIDESFPFDAKTMQTYSRDAARCEVWVTVPDVPTHKKICACLTYDKRKYAPRGVQTQSGVTIEGTSCRSYGFVSRFG